jgi:phosphoribosyl 1,2-cyclic phosphodiesterase
MADRDFIKFLGTAGARFVVARQLRSSAGVFLSLKGSNIILDPGPGTLVRCAGSRPPIDPGKLDGIILTHIHIDHSNDLNIMVDAMTDGGMRRQGLLFAPEEALCGDTSILLRYLRGFPKEIIPLREKGEYRIGEVEFSTSIRHRHGVETYGIRFDLGGRLLSFMVDTGYFPEIIESYKGSDTLVMNVVRYSKKGDLPHLSIDDVRQILENIRPKKAILTHFGMTMLKAKPWEVAKRLSEDLGIDIVSASDGMVVEV